MHLTAARRGDRVIVRTNFHPAWRAYADGAPLEVIDADGQLAFVAPRDGDLTVRLDYPRRLWLCLIALAAIVGGAALAPRQKRVVADDRG